jgi:hypothetical protein
VSDWPNDATPLGEVAGGFGGLPTCDIALACNEFYDSFGPLAMDAELRP